MLTNTNKHHFKIIKATSVDIFNTPTTILNQISNHSYLDILDGEIYHVIQDYNLFNRYYITPLDASLLASENLGFFRLDGKILTFNNDFIPYYNNLVLNAAPVPQFVFTKTYPKNYINCKIAEVDSIIKITYSELKIIADTEPRKEFESVYNYNNKLLLIKNEIVFSDLVSINSGKPYDDYRYWEFDLQPNILYKYIKRY